jgi:hypothetical protein
MGYNGPSLLASSHHTAAVTAVTQLRAILLTRNSVVRSKCEPFCSTYIATGQGGGLGRHLLVDAVLQASQVEVGISRKGTENNAGSMGTSGTDSVSDTGVACRIETNRSNGSNQQGDQDSRKDVQAQPN